MVSGMARVSRLDLDGGVYYAKFPPPKWGAETEKAVNEVLRLSSEKPKK